MARAGASLQKGGWNSRCEVRCRRLPGIPRPLDLTEAMGVSSLLLFVFLGQTPLDRTVTVTAVRPQRMEVIVPQGMALTGLLDQEETDLAIAVSDGHSTLATFDSRERASEPLAFVPQAAGRYVLEIRTVSATARGGSFRLSVAMVPATAAVSARAVAARHHTEAKALFGKGDREALSRALGLLGQARALWAGLGYREMELAALSGKGDVYYTMSAFAQAKAAYHEALIISRDRQDIRSEAEILNNLAMVLWPLGDVQEALEALDAAEARWRRLKFPYGEAIAVNNRGILLWESGEYDEARQAYEQALAMFGRLGETRGSAYALNNMGVLFEALGARQEALAFLGRAIALFRRTGDRVAEGRAEVRRARIHLAGRRRAAAWTSVTRALDVLEGTADRLAQADALAQRARSFEAEGRSPMARFEMHRALARYRELDSRRGISDALHDIGRSHLQDGDPDNAAAFLSEALEIRRALDLKALVAETHYQLGLIERARRLPDRARQHLEQAIGLVEAVRSGVLEKQLRASYAESKRQYYAAYISVLLDSHAVSPGAGFDRLALEASERAKSRGLAELLRESWNQVSSNVPADLRTREQSLRKRINYWSWQLWQRAAQPGAERVRQEIQTTLRTLTADHDAAMADIRRADPRFALLHTPEHITAEAIQGALAAHRATLVAYHLLDDATAVWVLTGLDMHVRRLAPRHDIERAARGFVARVSDRTSGATAAPPSARALSRAVFDPISALVRTTRVLFAPDGALHAVPWSALTNDAGEPLALLREISVTHSATVLTLLTREIAGRPPPDGLLAAIGDPVFDNSDPRLRRTPRSAPSAHRGTGLARLAHSREEVEQILALVPPSRQLRAVDFDASRALIMSEALRGYRIVHFATHAVQDRSQPSLSGIVLSMVDKAGQAQDGFVRLHDIYNLRLQADLVVLSACETGTGREWSGEGVASLARGLFHAGAARVVSTLWKVDDEATAALMQAFYGGLLRPDAAGPASALREAQARIRQDPRWRHPYYWAGFIVQGAW